MKVGVHFYFQNFRDWDRFLDKSEEPPEMTDQQVYEEDLALAELVEPLGFDSYWAIDHHYTPYAMTAGALQHLTYMAGRTRKIDLGTMVVVLPWYDPLVLCDQVSVLSNVLGDRHLTLGVGRGVARREYEPLRVPMSQARERFTETLDILRLAMTKEWFSYKGEIFDIPEASIRPRFRNPERLLQGMKAAWGTPATLEGYASTGVGMMMIAEKAWSEARLEVGKFNAVRRRHGWAPAQPTVAVPVSCFDSEQEAWASIRQRTIEANHNTLTHYELGSTEHFRTTKGYEQYAAAPSFVRTIEQHEETARHQAWGTPDQVLERLTTIQRLTGAEEFTLNFKVGTMSAEQAERSMRLFAAEVLPALQAYQADIDPELTGADPVS